MTRIATGRGNVVSAPAQQQPERPARAGRRVVAALAVGVLVGGGVAASLLPGALRWLESSQGQPSQIDEFQMPAAAKRQADAAAAKKSVEEAQAKAAADAKRQPATIEATERQRMPNTALVGDIIATESNRRSSLECRNTCLSRAGCKAYEYRLSGSICYLYRSVREQHSSTDAISGRWD